MLLVFVSLVVGCHAVVCGASCGWLFVLGIVRRRQLCQINRRDDVPPDTSTTTTATFMYNSNLNLFGIAQ